MKPSGIAAVASSAIIILLTGCSVPSSERSLATRSGAASVVTHTIAPIESGSENPIDAAAADALIALVTRLPPRAHAVASPPAGLDSVFSSDGCPGTQRSIFWVAAGWTIDDLTDWLREHPVWPLHLTATGHTAEGSVVTARSITEEPSHTYIPASAHRRILGMLVAALPSGHVGVRVEAEVTSAGWGCANPDESLVPTATADQPGLVPPDAAVDAIESARNLLARFSAPPGVRIVTTAPVPALNAPWERAGCGTVERHLFWIADGWTLGRLREYLLTHPMPGFVVGGAGSSTLHGVVRSLGIFEDRPPAEAPHRDAVDLHLVSIDADTVGVRVEAQVSPAGVVCLTF